MRRNMRRNIKHQTSNTKHQTSNIKRESGRGLVEGMIAAFVLVAVMLGMSSQMSALFRSTRSASNMADLTVVKSTIISRADCSRTATALSTTPSIASNCISTGKLVQLLDKNNNVLISNDDTSKTTLGPWTLRAICKQYPSLSYGIEIQAAQPRNPAATSLASTANDNITFREEPMLRQPLSWQNVSSYLVSSPGICANDLANPPAPSGTAGVTPKGGCKSFVKKGTTQSSANTQFFTNPMPWSVNQVYNYWRVLDVSCPTQYPVMMSVQVSPSCMASDKQSMLNASSTAYTSSGWCGNIFFDDKIDTEIATYGDPSGARAAERAQDIAICALNPVESRFTAYCAYTCCDL